MGGTFNPIHIGHLALAEYVLYELELDEVWFIPTGCSYMKSDIEIVSPLDRYQMTKKAIEDNPRMRCMDIEIKPQAYTYTYATLEQLREENPDCHFYALYGADCLFDIEKWKNPERIFANCTFVASVRNGSSLDEMQSKADELKERFQADIILLPFLNLELSSTDLRNKIASGKSVRYLVPDKVLSYIEEKGFYRRS